MPKPQLYYIGYINPETGRILTKTCEGSLDPDIITNIFNEHSGVKTVYVAGPIRFRDRMVFAFNLKQHIAKTLINIDPFGGTLTEFSPPRLQNN